MWLTAPCVCGEQRLKANLASPTGLAVEQIRVLIAWPRVLIQSPKWMCEALSRSSPSAPGPVWEARGVLLRTCSLSLLRPCAASMLKPWSGVCSVPTPGTLAWALMCPLCQFPPPCLPLTLSWVRVAMLMAVWKLKRQRTAYKSVDHMFSLPWLVPSAVWVSEPCPWEWIPPLLTCPSQHCFSVLALTSCWNVW